MFLAADKNGEGLELQIFTLVSHRLVDIVSVAYGTLPLSL